MGGCVTRSWRSILMTQLLFISMIELSVVNFDIFATIFSNNNKTVTPLKI